jgi:hypothetical protein
MEPWRVWAIPAEYCGEGLGSPKVVGMVKRSDAEEYVEVWRNRYISTEAEAAVRTANAVQREREEIASEMEKRGFQLPEGWSKEYVRAWSKEIRARGEGKPCTCHPHDLAYYGCRCKKPGKIARLDLASFDDGRWKWMQEKLNELIDAENARRA